MKERKPYEKPQVTRILVQPEASLIIPCKGDPPCVVLWDFGS